MNEPEPTIKPRTRRTASKKRKNKWAVALGKLRWANLTPDERRELAAKGGKKAAENRAAKNLVIDLTMPSA